MGGRRRAALALLLPRLAAAADDPGGARAVFGVAPARGVLVLAAAGRERSAGAHGPAAGPQLGGVRGADGADGEGRLPDAHRAAGLTRGAARTGRRRRGLGGADRAPAGGDAGALLRRRPRARDRRHRRADRDLRRHRRRVAAPEPLLPLPRDRQRHGRLGRAGRRDGQADRIARGDRLGGGRGAAHRSGGHRRSRPTAWPPRCTTRAAPCPPATCWPTSPPRCSRSCSGRSRPTIRRPKAPSSSSTCCSSGCRSCATPRSIRARPSPGPSTSTSPRPSSPSPTGRRTPAACPSWRRARSTATR